MSTGKTGANFIQVGPGGLCFAHGPYTEGQQCPKWPACITDPQQPEYVNEGHRRINAPKEHARLEREVIEAAKEWRKEKIRISQTTYTWERKVALAHETDTLLAAKVDALLAFEAKQ